jgi:hypothetical protein
VDQIWIWVATVVIVAAYLWSFVAWPRLPVRIAATVIFMAFYLSVLWFGSMDRVWQSLMPLAVVAAMAVFLVRGRSGRGATGHDRSPHRDQ